MLKVFWVGVGDAYPKQFKHCILSTAGSDSDDKNETSKIALNTTLRGPLGLIEGANYVNLVS